MRVGQWGAGDVGEAEGSRLSPTAERQPRNLHVAAVGPSLCQPRGEPWWPRVSPHPASRDGNESLRPRRVRSQVSPLMLLTHQPHPTTQGTQDSLEPALPSPLASPHTLAPASPAHGCLDFRCHGPIGLGQA